jgi:hypothetical protein
MESIPFIPVLKVCYGITNIFCHRQLSYRNKLAVGKFYGLTFQLLLAEYIQLLHPGPSYMYHVLIYKPCFFTRIVRLKRNL